MSNGAQLCWRRGSGLRSVWLTERLHSSQTQTAAEKQLKLLLDRVEKLREGAFARYSEQPIVRAVLMPVPHTGQRSGCRTFGKHIRAMRRVTASAQSSRLLGLLLLMLQEQSQSRDDLETRILVGSATHAG
jgi:hypothetical protein